MTGAVPLEDHVGAAGVRPRDLDLAAGKMADERLLAEAAGRSARRDRSARTGSSIVRSDSSRDAALNGRVGSWDGERAAQRPSAWKIGSLS